MPRDCDDTRLYYCLKCGHRWDYHPTHCGKLRHKLEWLGCLILLASAALSIFCLLKIAGWL